MADANELFRDPKQVQWVQSYYQTFKDLTEYVKQSFPHGILWNSNGVSPMEASKQVEDVQSPPSSSKSVGISGGPPPPPPPPGPAPRFEIDEKPAAPAAGAGGLGAVFSELNKGEAVTKGLRKVDPKEMTHKNPSFVLEPPYRPEVIVSPVFHLSIVARALLQERSRSQ